MRVREAEKDMENTEILSLNYAGDVNTSFPFSFFEREREREYAPLSFSVHPVNFGIHSIPRLDFTQEEEN